MILKAKFLIPPHISISAAVVLFALGMIFTVIWGCSKKEKTKRVAWIICMVLFLLTLAAIILTGIEAYGKV